MPQNSALSQAQSAPQTRDLDPNVRQRRAADPGASIWVSASAGTGKTKVLTDRVLRLLLPRDEELAGTPPHKILCLTFTKAGASEMTLRINKTLGNWAVMEEEALKSKLRDLLGRDAHDFEITAARKLFAQVVDTPGGLKIMTIHAFCQSVLGRFPLEAGISPGFKALEEDEAAELLSRAMQTAYSTPEEPLVRAIDHIAQYTNEDQFTALLRSLMSERAALRRTLDDHFGIDGFYTDLCTSLGVQPGKSPEDIIRDACADDVFDAKALQEAARALGQGTPKTDQPKAVSIAAFLHQTQAERAEIFDNYISNFLTQKGEIQKTLATAGVQKSMPDIIPILQTEAQRLLEVLDRKNAALCAALTRDLFLLGEQILTTYNELKENQGALDFDDLILKTLTLLQSRQGASWVLFKLDQGLDHILIDEAQDTNPEQWQIIEALAREFFSGQSARDDIMRTIFTVGDEKQSIYSFQRASPEEFSRMQGDFRAKITESGQQFDKIDLNISFRSSKSVLEAVDSVFSALGTRHHSFRTGQAGHVELWPLFETAKPEEPDLWNPPTEIVELPSGAGQCANFIASQIEKWLKEGEILPSHGRPIEPGDIMILLRSRSAFVGQLTRALKLRSIPVSGVDRMILSQQLPVQDLTALAAFALHPQDDLSLACVLKSPLIGWNEDALYNLAIDRPSSLWAALQKKGGTEAKYLAGLITEAGRQHPYDFFAQILHRPCPADDRSGLRAIKKRLGEDALDPLDEFLNAALNFERNHIPGLQGFMQYFASDEAQIKREMQEAGKEVRIMTVHGSKGLQAPIVILPDTVLTGSSKKIDRLVFNVADKQQSKKPTGLPMWSPRAETDCSAYSALLNQTKSRLDEEYQRLLYVAMTRAEDKLYVTGYKGLKNGLPDSWYFKVKSGLEALQEVEHTETGLVLSNPQTREPDRARKVSPPPAGKETPPHWLFSPAPEEPDPPTPLIPSRAPSHEGETEPAALSPLQSQDLYRFRRGNITHKLLQFLPSVPIQQREEAAQTFTTRHGRDLAPEVRESIVTETLAILDYPYFKAIFGPDSLAEVPVSGLLPDKRLISGQIDRLLITENEVLIVDFKTNRPPPLDPANIPPVYRRQMQAYRDVLAEIYPNHTIRCALLWTDGPHLMEIPDL